MFRAIALAILIVLTSPVRAVLPEGGWYWNPAEPGRGFNIEIQDNTLFVAAFIYDAQGVPLWAVSGGPMTGDHVYTGELYRTSGGQCLGCAFTSAATETSIGQISITFQGTHAAIAINGVAFSVQRFDFALDFGSTAQPLRGEWAIVSGESSFPVYFAERILFSDAKILQGELTATGNRAGSLSSVAVGGFDATLGKWTILMDSSTSYYRYYVFTFAGFDRIEGDEYLFKKTDLPTTSDPFIGHRIKSATAASGLIGPGTGKSDTRLDSFDEARADTQNSHKAVSIDPNVQSSALALSARLRAMAE